MRSLVSFVLGALAVLAVALALPGLWFERNVVDEGGYVALVGPLGEDPEFRASLADTVSAGVLRASGLDGTPQRLAEPVVQRVAHEMTELGGFDTAWSEANQLSHRLNVTDIPPAELDGRLGVDLTPMVTLVTDTANQRLGRQLLSAPEDLVIAVGTPEHRSFVDRARDMAPQAWILAGVAAALMVACVGVSRRRSTAVIGLGVGLLLVVVAQFVAVTAGGGGVVDAVANEAGFGRTLMEHLHEAVAESYGMWLLVLAALGVVAVVAGAIGRVRSQVPRG